MNFILSRKNQSAALTRIAVIGLLAMLFQVAVARGADVPHTAEDSHTAEDPRPAIVILGDMNSLPFAQGPAWPVIVQHDHPDWNIVNLSDGGRTLPMLLEKIDAILDAQAHVEDVLIFTGVPDAAAKVYAENPADKLGPQMAALLKKLKDHTKTAHASIVLITPMPIIDARLDQYSKVAYAGGEAHCDAIAAAFAKAGQDAGVTVNDFHIWEKEQKNDGVPGPLLGSLGFRIRDWGHPTVAKYMDALIVAQKPAPADPAAFELWKKEFEAAAKLNQILHDTSEGLVDHSRQALEAKLEKSDAVVTIDAGELQGSQLNLVMLPKDGKNCAIGNAANLPVYKPVLAVKTDAGDVKIPLLAGDVAILDESMPNTAVDPASFRFNRGKMNYFAVTGDEPGKRRWVVMRFDLSSLSGKKPTGATLTFAMPDWSLAETMTAPGKYKPGLPGELGEPAVYLIKGADTDWQGRFATWASRDGSAGWTGGKIDAPARKKALLEFIAAGAPASAAKRAGELIAN